MGRGREGFLYSSLFFNQIIFLQIIKMILQFDKLIITFVNNLFIILYLIYKEL